MAPRLTQSSARTGLPKARITAGCPVELATAGPQYDVPIETNPESKERAPIVELTQARPLASSTAIPLKVDTPAGNACSSIRVPVGENSAIVVSLLLTTSRLPVL